jgi:membrane peptidoglycan carboxypeptidase
MGNHTQPPSRSGEQADARRAKDAKRERRHPVWRWIGYTSLGVGACVTVVAGAAVGYVTSMLKGLPSVSAKTFANMSEPSVVYDRNGKVIGRFSTNGDRQPIESVKQVSPFLVNAFIAAEDKTFYSNIGVNPLAMGRAVIQDLLGHRILSGASTITQQTVKLAMFPEQERTAKRKIQEIALALEVNHMLTKDEIMTDYMNWVYMGRMGNNNVYGVKVASDIMFHKDVKYLTLPEAAFLAAIPNNASLFSPYLNPKNTVQREHYILDQMLQDKMITKAQYDAAMKVDVVKELKEPPPESTPYPYVMRDNVEPLVAQALVQSGKYATVDDAEKALPTAGFKIYTTIDLSAQDAIDKVLKNNALFQGSTVGAVGANGQPIRGKNGKQLQDLYEAGATLIDNQSGGILAIGGGRDFNNGAYVDHSDIPRKPGSAIKPLLDYGPALDMRDITAASPLFDAPHTWIGAGGAWSPRDAEPDWEGIMTARRALVQSRNLPAVRLLQQITPKAAWPYMARMGITPQSKTLRGQTTLTPDDESHLSAAIGGMTYGLTVQQMTSAYTVFANQGVWRPAYMIQKVTDRDGTILYQHKAVTPQKVFSPQTAYIMTDILHGVLYDRDGTATAVGSHFPGYYISGKTGTTDDHRDGWFIGYTQKYTMGLWMGYDYNEVIPNGSNGGPDWYDLKFKVWNMMMDPILKKDPPTTPWQRPPGITTMPVCSKSGELPTSLCKSDNDVYSELFIQGTEPTSPCKTHVNALYTVVNGRKYLATTNTPPGEIRQGVFLVPPEPLPPGVVTADSAEYLPSQPDPRGGTILRASTKTQLQSLPAPAHIQAMADPSGKVHLSWDAVKGATRYSVWRATSPDGPFSNIAGPMAKTDFTDSKLPTGASTLYYEVYATSNSGFSPPSQPVAVTVFGVPGVPGQPGNPGGTNNSTGNTPGTGTANGNGLPEMLWPSEEQSRARG